LATRDYFPQLDNAITALYDAVEYALRTYTDEELIVELIFTVFTPPVWAALADKPIRRVHPSITHLTGMSYGTLEQITFQTLRMVLEQYDIIPSQSQVQSNKKQRS
jgi:hypothetical protein